MVRPIKYYGGVGWILVGLFALAGALAVDPLLGRAFLGLFGTGSVLLGLRVYRESAVSGPSDS